jgi:hypothetical protein
VIDEGQRRADADKETSRNGEQQPGLHKTPTPPTQESA